MLDVLHWFGLPLLFMAAAAMPASAATLMRGNLGVHDPSTVIKCKDRYYVFATGRGIASKSSADHTFWQGGPSVFRRVPAWTTNAVPDFTGTFWAPDVIYFNNLYHLYYAVSTFGSQISAIGLATNPTLDPSDPAYQWTDQGPVIQSTIGSPYNTIDPSVTFDAAGNLWMSFGSYWNGIYLVQLDPATGLRIGPNSPTYRLASHSSIEASCIYYRSPYYYLFVNWGSCCSGIESTYNIRVGRSTSITGPYYDRNGVDMRSSGGTLFLEATGKYYGPGHMGILSDTNGEWFSYHYYDAGQYGYPVNGGTDYGLPMFDMEPLSWTANGWPAFTNDWSAVYRFEADARDDRGQYYGLMQGATIANDPVLGRVANFSPPGQYVWLPVGVADARTFVAVVKWNGGAAWQRIFDFGRDTSSYCFLTPSSANGKVRFAITTGGIGAEQIVEGPIALPVGQWMQVAVTLDGSRGVLYLNGNTVAINTSMNLSPLALMATNNFLGKSRFAADPDFNGQISSFRVFGRALSLAEIVAPQPRIEQPADGAPFWPGQTITFSGKATDFADVPLAAGALGWTVRYSDGGSTNLVLGPLAGVADGQFAIPLSGNGATNGSYTVLLAATDSLGRKWTNSVSLYPATSASVGNWSAYYPFDSGADDAGGQFNGTLMSGASIQSDPQRGNVLNLSGSSQYISLPPGVGAAQTLSAWVKWNGGSTWQRVFDFGADTSHYLYFTPLSNSGKPRLAICPESRDELSVDAPTAFPVGTWMHVAAVFDGREAVLYLNGAAVAVNNSVNVLPSDLGANHNYFGKSQFSADAYFNGRLDSVRLDSSALAPEQFLTPDYLQPALSLSRDNSNVFLAWPDWAVARQLYATTNLSPPVNWVTVTNAPVMSNGWQTLTLPIQSGDRFYRLQSP